jgi:hypothetical protein
MIPSSRGEFRTRRWYKDTNTSGYRKDLCGKEKSSITFIGGIKMKKASRIIKKALFQVSWVTWTPAKRYVYLWQRTCSRPETGIR